MGFFDEIAKRAKEAAKTASDAVDKASENMAESIATVKNTIPNSDIISAKAEKIKSDVKNINMDDVGNYALDMGKLVTGVTAYEQRKAAAEKKEEADKIMKETTDEIEKIRFLANNRLETFGHARCEMLRTTVGRFIRIVNMLNNSVKAKDYDLSSSLTISDADFAELESVEMNASNLLTTAATGGSIAAAALAGVPAAVNATVAALCSASTGTAISQLSGAAARQATLAWLGGGSLASGGGGVAAGTTVLAGITWAATGVMALASVAVVAGKIYSQKNTDAEKYLADTKVWSAKAKAAAEIMHGVVRRSDELLSVTSRLEGRIIPALDSLEALVPKFDSSDSNHAETFQRAAILVKSMSELAQTPLLDDSGNLNEQSLVVAQKTQRILNHTLS